MLKPLLSAHWRYLATLNFAIDPKLLLPSLPAGTELDFHQGETYLSLVGFLFYHTVVTGLPMPPHRNFEQVDLRFYVRKKSADRWRRGIVCIRELVPRTAIAITARVFPGEPYQALPMRSDVTEDDDGVSTIYEWRRGKKWERMSMKGRGAGQTVAAGSHEEFLTARDWSYTKRASLTTEYRVEHPRWKVRPADQFEFKAEVATLYGQQFAEPLGAEPVSAFIADGSFVQVLARA